MRRVADLCCLAAFVDSIFCRISTRTEYMTNLSMASYGIFFAEQPIILMVPLRLKDWSTDLDVSKEVSLAVLVNHVGGRLHKHATKLTRKMRSSVKIRKCFFLVSHEIVVLKLYERNLTSVVEGMINRNSPIQSVPDWWPMNLAMIFYHTLFVI